MPQRNPLTRRQRQRAIRRGGSRVAGVRVSAAGQSERSLESSVELGKEPVREYSDPLLQDLTVDRRDLGHVYHRVGWEHAEVDGNWYVAGEGGEVRRARDDRDGHGPESGAVVLIGAEDHNRPSKRRC